ncbi:hypothetical protein [Pseudobacteriovorax antillogorgiicola]|uniref:Uncharacterized protein n=1 Tax=Pseudobacteriovorax antillogorgiicola TaxID=1513793 RepID=A0A1Y6BD83_9BACT|nr:hypothetical protein [Pseudobacteriovorax antillogorgiicola]TCS56439.1 hypothetical protein EDD56_104261 [Pseudobacteriovorax antillogorgiicola]SMF05458.1 hypothetical protein SAMN06296036_10472 [Pseudobacteriovorax antillogorgiicola]
MLILGSLSGCSLESEGLRSIRAHSYGFLGIAHAVPMKKAERYCQYCHGENLVGGDQGEPSCYQCHGRRWRDGDPFESAAPDDHTVVNGIYRHHPDLETPLTTCVNCHGSSLEGNGTDDTPSCYLCHGQLWP